MGHFSYVIFWPGIVFSGDILARGFFPQKDIESHETFWPGDILAREHFGQGTFWPGDIMARGHFGQGTFWPVTFWLWDILARY